jgi:hypothetical protein
VGVPALDPRGPALAPVAAHVRPSPLGTVYPIVGISVNVVKTRMPPASDHPKHDPALPPREPPEDIEREQEPDQTPDDFLRDLAKVTRRKPASGPDQGSSRT